MSLVVEDGTGLTNAESYSSVAFGDAFHAARQNFNWPTGSDTGSVAMKEAALRRASDYMVAVYRSRWLGARAQPLQGLDWPRVGVTLPDITQWVDDVGFYQNVQANVVPVQVQQACALLALKAMVTDSSGNAVDLAPDVGRVTSMEKVGSLEVQYEKGSLPFTRYRVIDDLLGVFLSGGTLGIKLMRA